MEIVSGVKSPRVGATPLTPAQRTLRARIGGFALHSKYDSREITAPARAAFLRRFEIEVDPEGVLAPNERAKRAKAARSAYFTRLSFKSSQKRMPKARRGATGQNHHDGIDQGDHPKS